MTEVGIRTDTIRLDQLLKLAGAVASGGEVKYLVSEGLVRVNGQPETARRRQLSVGDVATILTDQGEASYRVVKGA